MHYTFIYMEVLYKFYPILFQTQIEILNLLRKYVALKTLYEEKKIPNMHPLYFIGYILNDLIQ